MTERLGSQSRSDKQNDLETALNIALAALGHFNTEQTDEHWNKQERVLREIEKRTRLTARSAGTRLFTFVQVRDAIVTRMSGHTFSLRDAQAVENFMGLLGLVEESECSLPRVTQSATEEFADLAAFMVKEDADVDICYPGNHGGPVDKWLVTVMRGHLIAEHFGATLAEAVANATDSTTDRNVTND